MKFSFEAKAKVSPEEIWTYYADINKWFVWEDDLLEITLDGEFISGTEGSMTLEGMPPMKYRLTEVTSNKSFTDKTIIENIGEISFIHELIRDNDMTIIRHSVEFISQKNVDTLNESKFVSQVFSDVPSSIFKLIEVVLNDSI